MSTFEAVGDARREGEALPDAASNIASTSTGETVDAWSATQTRVTTWPPSLPDTEFKSARGHTPRVIPSPHYPTRTKHARKQSLMHNSRTEGDGTVGIWENRVAIQQEGQRAGWQGEGGSGPGQLAAEEQYGLSDGGSVGLVGEVGPVEANRRGVVAPVRG